MMGVMQKRSVAAAGFLADIVLDLDAVSPSMAERAGWIFEIDIVAPELPKRDLSYKALSN